MKPRLIFILLAAIIVVGTLLILFGWKIKQDKHVPGVSKQAASETSKVSPHPASQAATHQQVQPTFPKGQSDAEKEKTLRGLFENPISFYGKVVDQNRMPVEGAKVRFGANDNPDRAASEHFTTSDVSGLFSITGLKGIGLSVRVAKDGYYSTKQASKEFSYYSPEVQPVSPTSPDKPWVFVLNKMGIAEALIKFDADFPIRKDGTPVEVSLSTGSVVAVGKGDVRVEAWTEQIDPGNWRQYNWRCRLSVPGGGLVERVENLNFEAPVNGYQPSMEVNMPSNAERWQSQFQGNYFVRLADGRFGRLTFRMVAGGDHFFRLESFINPKLGSRNLEYDPAQTISNP